MFWKNSLRLSQTRHWKDYILSMWCLWNCLIYAVRIDCDIHMLTDWPCWSSCGPVDRVSVCIILCTCWLSMWIILCTCWYVPADWLSMMCTSWLTVHDVYQLTDCPWNVPADWLSMMCTCWLTVHDVYLLTYSPWCVPADCPLCVPADL